MPVDNATNKIRKLENLADILQDVTRLPPLGDALTQEVLTSEERESFFRNFREKVLAVRDQLKASKEHSDTLDEKTMDLYRHYWRLESMLSVEHLRTLPKIDGFKISLWFERFFLSLFQAHKKPFKFAQSLSPTSSSSKNTASSKTISTQRSPASPTYNEPEQIRRLQILTEQPPKYEVQKSAESKLQFENIDNSTAGAEAVVQSLSSTPPRLYRYKTKTWN